MSHSFAAGSSNTNDARFKRFLEVGEVEDRFIELPGEAVHGQDPHYTVGSNIYMKLIEALSNGESQGGKGKSEEPDPIFVGDQPISSAKIDVKILELAFTAGRKGNRTFYGFRDGFENAWNDGKNKDNLDEYLLKNEGDLSYFSREFADGRLLRVGLELSKGFDLEAMVAGLKLRNNIYRASLGIELKITSRFGKISTKKIFVRGKGFFVDVDTHLMSQAGDFRLAFTIARRAAMKKAFDGLMTELLKQVRLETESLALFTHLAFKDTDGTLYISSGENMAVKIGQRFYSRTDFDAGVKPKVCVVQKVYSRVSKITCDQDVSDASVNSVMVSLRDGEPVPNIRENLSVAEFASTSSETKEVAVPDVKMPAPEELMKFLNQLTGGLAGTVVDLATLPYQVYRYLSYDQKYSGPSKKTTGEKIKVAVIDSGIDYNHRDLRNNIFVDQLTNPGFDFISGDNRPYDDHAHGTEIASLILGVTKNVELMPVKAFTPYGMTSSSAIYSAFEYAVQNGARIIVAAWASKIKSRALEDALRLARDHDVLVVTSSGEDGVDLEKSPQYPASFKKDYANVVVAGAYGKDGKVRSNFGDLVDVFVMTEKLKVANPRGSHFKRTENSFGAGVLAGAAAASFQACKSLKVQDFVEVLRKIRAQTPDITRLNLPSLLDKINQDCKL